MKATELLTIDVAAELRRVASASLEGPWQVPAELVRRAVAAGARQVAVEMRRGALVVQDDGAAPTPDVQRALGCLLDEARPPQERHQALLALEGEPELLALAALRPRRVRVEDLGPGGGCVIRIDAPGFDPAAARRWLATRARFAPVEIRVDGAALPRGFGPVLAEAALEAPLQGRLALRVGTDVAHLWLMSAGIVSSHLTLPDTPAFEAAVELRPLAVARTPAALREAIGPHLSAVVAQAVALMLDVAVHRQDLSETARRLLRTQLLVAARRGWGASEVLRAPLFRAMVGPEGREERCLSLADLGHLRTVPCLEPGERPTDFLLPHGPVLVVDAEERGRLAQLLGVRFRAVEQRRLRVGGSLRLRRIVSSLARMGGRIAARVRHPGRGAIIPTAALSGAERALLSGLRGALADGEDVVIIGGAGPTSRVGSRWHLPRRNPYVDAAARAVGHDARWARVAALALLARTRPPG